MSAKAGVTTAKPGIWSGTTEAKAKTRVVTTGTDWPAQDISRCPTRNATANSALGVGGVGFRTLAGPRRRHGALRQDAGETEIGNAHHLDPRQFGEGFDPYQRTIDGGNDAHRQARRKDAAAAAGHDTVADPRTRLGLE